MNKSEIKYFEYDDVLHFVISNEREAGSLEISPNITAKINGDGELIGIEILNASTFVWDYIMEMAQAKIFGLANRQFKRYKYPAGADENVTNRVPIVIPFFVPPIFFNLKISLL